MTQPISPDMSSVSSSSLAGGDEKLVGMKTHTPDVLGVAQVVSLALVLHVVQNHHGRHEVGHLPRGEEVEVGPGVSPPVSVHPLQLQLAGGRGGDFGHAVGLQLAGGTDQVDGAAPKVEPDHALLRRELAVLGPVPGLPCLAAAQVLLGAEGRPQTGCKKWSQTEHAVIL